MFKIQREREFWWPVKVQLPADGGKHETHEFDVRLRQSSLPKMIEAMAQASKAGEPEKQFQAFQTLITGWRRIANEDGGELDFNAANFKALLEVPTAAAGLIEAIRQAFLPPAPLERRRGN